MAHSHEFEFSTASGGVKRTGLAFTYTTTKQTQVDFVFLSPLAYRNPKWSVLVMYRNFDLGLKSWISRLDCKEDNLFKNYFESRGECIADG